MSASAAREEVRQRFEDGDLGAQALPHAAQFQADHAGADHAQALGHRVEIQRAGVVDDVLAVELRERQFDRHRAGGEDHVGAPEFDSWSRRAAVTSTCVALQQLADAEERRDLVAP